MKKRNLMAGLFVACAAGFYVWAADKGVPAMENKTITLMKNGKMVETQTVVKTDADWKKALTPEQYYILRQQGTERAFTGKYDHIFDKGLYVCAACGNDLFASDAKYNSGCGWPAFFQPVSSNNVQFLDDRSHGMVRTEVRCAKCGGHLGHVFNDGPKPTGIRFCINSGSIELKKPE